MRRALLLMLLLCLPASVRAMWALVPVEELVQGSDIIVVGTLRGVREHTADDVDYGEGRIEVREVIWGDVAPGDSLLLKWDNPSAIACPRVEHRGRADTEGIWLLTRAAGFVEANYPGRFVELSGRGSVEAALLASPVVLRADKYRVGRGDPLLFAVVYRNAADAPREFPGVSSEAGATLFTRGSKLNAKVERRGEEKGVRLAGRFAADRAVAPVTVGPRSERRFDVDLSRLMAEAPSDGDRYFIKLKLPGVPETHELRFYVGGPPSPRPEAEAPPPPAPSSEFKFTGHTRRGLPPPARAVLAALAALLLFPVFRRLRASMITARLARVLHGAQTWQI